MTQITALNTKLLVDGYDLTAYMNDYDIERTLKNKTGNMIKIYMNQSVAATFTFNSGAEIILSEGTVTNTDYRVFKGKIFRTQPNDTEIIVTGRSKLHEFGGDYFSVTYDINIDPEAGVISAIAEDITEEGGYTMTAVNSGTDVVLRRYRARDQTRLERLATLAKILDWVLDDDFDTDTFIFQPKGYTSFATPLVVGTNILNVPVWDENVEPMKNKIKIKGAFEEGTVATSFTGDGTTTTVDLTYSPTGTSKVTNTTTVTELRRGIADSTDVADYQIDEDLKTLTFTVAPTLSDVITIEYVANLPKDVEGENSASIASTNITSGAVFEFKDIQNVEDAETRLTQLLDLIGDPFVSTTLWVNRTYNISPGNVVTVTDPQRPERSGSYVVTSVTRSYFDPYIIVKIGDTDFDVRDLYESINARLQAIEDANLADTTLLRQILANIGSFVNIQFRYEDIYTRDMVGTTYMYWDYPSSIGNWDSEDWAPEPTGDPITDGYTLEYRTQGNNTWIETIEDTDFYNSAVSTGTTWNTGTQTLTVNAGSMLTKHIAIGTSYRYATLYVGASTGTYTLEVSGDNGVTWNTVLPGVRTTLTIGFFTHVVVRITSAASSTFTNTPISNPINGLYVVPALELVLEQ